MTGGFGLADNGSGASLGRETFVGFPAGAIAIVDRGVCGFAVKVANAQAARAVGVIVANNPITMGGVDPTITIPAVMVSQADGATVKAGLPATGGTSANDPPPVCRTGLHMINIDDPTKPTFAGCFDGHGTSTTPSASCTTARRRLPRPRDLFQLERDEQRSRRPAQARSSM